jgi:hypothetical protein
MKRREAALVLRREALETIEQNPVEDRGIRPARAVRCAVGLTVS